MSVHHESLDPTRRGFLAGTCAVALTLARPGRAAAAERPIINLNWQYGELSLHTFLRGLQQLRLAEKYHFRMSPMMMLYGAESVQNYVAGRGDIVGSGEFPALTNVLRVPDTTWIATCSVGNQNVVIISKPEIRGLKDLAGKRIALPFGSASEWCVRQVLADLAGMDADREVKLLHALPAATLTLMARGEADAAVIWAPWPQIGVLQHGFKVLEWGVGSKYATIAAIYIRNRFLAGNEELVQDFCRAAVDNLKYIYEHVEEAALWVAQSPYLGQDFETVKVALRVLAGLPDPRIQLPKEATNNLVPWRKDVPDILERANGFMKAHPPKGTSWAGVPSVKAKINSTYITKAIRDIAPEMFGSAV